MDRGWVRRAFCGLGKVGRRNELMAKKGARKRSKEISNTGSRSRKIPAPLRSTVLPSPEIFQANPAWGENKSKGIPAYAFPTVGLESVSGLRTADSRPCASVGLE